VRHPLLVMVYLENDAQASRIGISTSRAVGNAVKRNRARRVLRHALQPMLSSISPGWDIVLIARKPIGEAAFLVVQEALNSLLQRANLIVDENELENC
jgi:ribonuclease P protein component